MDSLQLLGEQIDHYLVKGFIDEGGTAVVYLASDTQSGKEVVLKILRPELVGNQLFQEHFRESSMVMAQLPSLSVARVFEQGSYEDRPYVALEYIDGGSLASFIRQYIAQEKTLRLQKSLDLIRQIAEALSEVHAQGVIHGDLKPSNILFRRRHGELEIVLIDFNPNGVSSSSRFGSAHYMSPEQAQHQTVTRQSDLYSLGVISYQLLTGWLPYQVDSQQIAEGNNGAYQPKLPQHLNPQLWQVKGIDTFLLKALAQEPAKRYINIQEFCKALLDVQLKVSKQSIPVSFNLETYSQAYTQPLIDINKTNLTGRLDINQTWGNSAYRFIVGNLWSNSWIYPVSNEMTVIRLGRSRQNDLLLIDHERMVSGVHALLTRKGDAWFVEDLGSENGVYKIKDGQKEALSRRTQHPWEPDTILQIGSYFLKWQKSRLAQELSDGLRLVDEDMQNGRSSSTLHRWNTTSASTPRKSVDSPQLTRKEYENLPKVALTPSSEQLTKPTQALPSQPSAKPVIPAKLLSQTAATAGIIASAGYFSNASDAPIEYENFMDGAFVAQLDNGLLLIEAGQQVQCTLTLISKQSVTDTVKVWVESHIPESWIGISPQSHEINPRDTGRFTVSVGIPEEGEIEAGDHSFAIMVAGGATHAQDRIDAVIRIGTKGDFSIGLQYSKLKESDTFQATLINESNAKQRYLIEGKDDENALNFKFEGLVEANSNILYDFEADPKWIDLPAGVHQMFSFRVEPRSTRYRNKFLKTKTYPFQMQAKTGKSGWQQAEGQVETRPLITKMILAVLVGLLVACGLLSAGSFVGYQAYQTAQANATATSLAQLGAIERTRAEATASAEQFLEDIEAQPEDESIQALATQTAEEYETKINGLIETVTIEAIRATEGSDIEQTKDLADKIIDLVLTYDAAENKEIPEDTDVNTIIGRFSVEIATNVSEIPVTPIPRGKSTFSKLQDNENIIYTLLDGDDYFRIVGNELQLRQSLDYEKNTFHYIRVKADNLQGSTIEKQFRIEVLDVDDAPRISIVEVVDINERRGEVSVKVEIDRASVQEISVDYSTDDAGANSADSDVDYEAKSGTLTWESGDTADKIITITLIDDDIYEPDEESFWVVLANVDGGVIEEGLETAVINIIDDDSLPTLIVEDATFIESAGAIEIPVTYEGSSNTEVSVQWETADISSGSVALDGEDYSGDSGELRWTVSQSGDTKYIRISIDEDDIYEEDEIFEVILSEPVNATIEREIATITIEDNDTIPTITIADTINTESSGTATVLVTLNGSSSKPVTVKYATTDEGTAVASVDFEATNGLLTWQPGDSASKTIDVPILDDEIQEDNETIVVRLSGATEASIDIDQATITIDDSDNSPVLIIEDVTVDEAEGSAELTVSLSGGSSSPIAVSYAVVASIGTSPARLDLDLVEPTTTQLNWSANEVDGTKTIYIEIVDDILDEPTETFQVVLSSPNGASIQRGRATVTITDNDDPPTIIIEEASFVEGNSGGEMEITIKMEGGSSQEITVDYETVDAIDVEPYQSAVVGEDYTRKTGQLVWLADVANEEHTVKIPIIDDIIDELDEEFILRLLGFDAQLVTIEEDTRIVTIKDDDDIPSIYISENPPIQEGSGVGGITVATVKLCLEGGSSRPIDLVYELGDDEDTAKAGIDYVAEGNNTINWDANSFGECVEREINLDIIQDKIYEREDEQTQDSPTRSEFLTVKLSTENEYVKLINESASVVIVDDDKAPILQFRYEDLTNNLITSVPENLEDLGSNGVYVEVEGETSRPIIFHYRTSIVVSEATSNIDFDAVDSTQITLPIDTSSEKLEEIRLKDDDLFEADERFYVVLGNTQDVRLSDDDVDELFGYVNIENDEPTPIVNITTLNTSFSEDNGEIQINIEITQTSSVTIEVPFNIVPHDSASVDDFIVNTQSPLVWPPRTTKQTIIIDIINDDFYEPDLESFTLTLNNPLDDFAVLGADSSENYEIEETDPLPKIELRDANFNEDDAEFIIEAELTNGIGHANGIVVTCETQDDEALSSHDYEANNNIRFIWADEDTTSIQGAQIEIENDSFEEPAQNFSITNCSIDTDANIEDDSATITINDDPNDVATLSIVNAVNTYESGLKGTNTVLVEVTLEGGFDVDKTISLSTSSVAGSALPGSPCKKSNKVDNPDYKPTSEEIIFEAFLPTTKSMEVTICNDKYAESAEMFNVLIVNNDGIQTLNDTSEITILPDRPTIDYVLSNPVLEGATDYLKLDLTQNCGETLRIDYWTEEDTARGGNGNNIRDDFEEITVGNPKTVSWGSDNNGEKKLDIDLYEDGVYESGANEQFFVHLEIQDNNDCAFLVTDMITVTIEDNSNIPTISIDTTDGNKVEEGDSVSFDVELDGFSDEPVQVTVGLDFDDPTYTAEYEDIDWDNFDMGDLLIEWDQFDDDSRTQTLQIPIKDDDLYVGEDENLLVYLDASTVTNGIAIDNDKKDKEIFIEDRDTLSISIDSDTNEQAISLPEGDIDILYDDHIFVRSTIPSENPIVVAFELNNLNSPTEGVDFSGLNSRQITIPANQNAEPFDLTILGDLDYENNEVFEIEIESANGNGNFINGSRDTIEITIPENDVYFIVPSDTVLAEPDVNDSVSSYLLEFATSTTAPRDITFDYIFTVNDEYLAVQATYYDQNDMPNSGRCHQPGLDIPENGYRADYYYENDSNPNNQPASPSGEIVMSNGTNSITFSIIIIGNCDLTNILENFEWDEFFTLRLEEQAPCVFAECLEIETEFTIFNCPDGGSVPPCGNPLAFGNDNGELISWIQHLWSDRERLGWLSDRRQFQWIISSNQTLFEEAV